MLAVVFLALVVLLVVLTAATWLGHDPHAVVALRRRPRTPIALAHGDAEVCIVGIVRSIHTRTAPESGATCVLYHAITEELQRHGRYVPGLADTTWVRTGDDVDAGDFWLDDGTGRALVVAGGALLRPQFVHARYALANELEDRRSFEALVVDGDRIAVCGHATWEESDEPIASTAPELDGRHLVIRADERRPIVISDDPALLGA